MKFFCNRPESGPTNYKDGLDLHILKKFFSSSPAAASLGPTHAAMPLSDLLCPLRTHLAARQAGRRHRQGSTTATTVARVVVRGGEVFFFF